MKNIEIVLTKGTSVWGSGTRWKRRGREVLCGGTLNRTFHIPKRATELTVVFSEDKPRHRQAYTLMPYRPPSVNMEPRTALERWSRGPYMARTRYIKEFRGQFLTGADLILHSKYGQGYRYVWLEV
jgi:hypothetical protein